MAEPRQLPITADEKAKLATALLLGIASVQEAKHDGSKVDFVAILADFFEANTFAHQATTQVPLGAIDGDHPVRIGLLDSKVIWILEFRQSAGIRSRRCSIQRSRCGLLQGLVGSLMVVFLTEGIKGTLLSAETRARGPKNLRVVGGFLDYAC